MRKYISLSILALTASVAADHPALGGNWVLDPSHSDTGVSKIKGETLLINQQPEAVQLSETITAANGKETTSEISCSTTGETCKIKDHGQAEISFWYNGGMLVMSETRHGNDWAVRRRLKASDDGRTLTIEVIYLAPTQKTETLTFTRTSARSGGSD
jgi:hypothetical protein